jgi:cytochrome b6-f complex iron-sulfur subunit
MANGVVLPPVSETANGAETQGRRSILKMFLGASVFASLSSFVYPVLRYLVPPAELNLGADQVLAATMNELKPNSSKVFRFGSKPALLLRTDTGEFKAMSAVCTHLSCTVQYRPDMKEIWCACHNGFYDINGKNVSGPPPRPLEQFAVHVKGEEIFVSRNQGA